MPCETSRDTRHAVDLVQQTLGAVVGRHSRSVAEIGGEPGLEHVGIVVLAHRLPGGERLRGAVDDSPDQLFAGRPQFDRSVELRPLFASMRRAPRPERPCAEIHRE